MRTPTPACFLEHVSLGLRGERLPFSGRIWLPWSQIRPNFGVAPPLPVLSPVFLPAAGDATIVSMRHGIVEGEPGIYPDPVARLLRAVGGLFRRRKDRTDPPPPGSEPADDRDADPAPDRRPDG